MSPKQAAQLGEVLKVRREKLGLSIREAGRRADIDYTTVYRLEQGLIRGPRSKNLAALFRVLGLSIDETSEYTGWVTTTTLPTFTPYLRSKYGDLPKDAITELEGFFDYLRNKHGLAGPQAGEDEQE